MECLEDGILENGSGGTRARLGRFEDSRTIGKIYARVTSCWLPASLKTSVEKHRPSLTVICRRNFACSFFVAYRA